MKNIILYFLLLSIAINASAQDSLFTKLAIENIKTIYFDGTNFKGEGWDFIKSQVKESSNVLIGEDHFSNEIPAFTKVIAKLADFDNFIIEVDPYSTEIIENAILNLSDKERTVFNEKYKDLFSFYALQPEYELLEQIVKSGTNILGADQIVMYADRLVCQELLQRTKNETAKEIYRHIMEQSRIHLEQFFENPQNGSMYLMTPAFAEKLEELALLDLSDYEKLVINDLKNTIDIYKKSGHKKRIKLIKHQLIKDFSKWKDAKNLFKFGAVHMARGESFLTVYDVGNLVANITDSNFEKSFHIMIIGRSGMVGSPFKTFPPTKVDAGNGLLSSFYPFFELTKKDAWYLFDLLPLRKAVEKDEITVENTNLLRAIKGYDALIIIPEFTAARW